MLTIPLDIYNKIISSRFVPDTTRVLRAFSYFAPRDTKVIIIGEDPYTNRKDATGLAFSVEHDKLPPSLKNIFKELCSDMGYKQMPKSGNLERWAKQGVLLINTILTTEEGKSLSHQEIGWEDFTKEKIQHVLNLKTPVVIIGWGDYAQSVIEDLKLHEDVLVLTGGHPSPLNRKRDFFGKKYFSKTNNFLRKHGLETIKWKI